MFATQKIIKCMLELKLLKNILKDAGAKISSVKQNKAGTLYKNFFKYKKMHTHKTFTVAAND